MTLTFKMKAQFVGGVSLAGPFDIYRLLSGETVHSILSNGIDTATGITKNTLDAGYSISNVSDNIVSGYVESTGQCGGRAYWVSPGQPPLPYSAQLIIGFSPVGATQAENSVGVMEPRDVYMRISDGLYFNYYLLTVLISGWYVFDGEQGLAPRHFIDGVEQV